MLRLYECRLCGDTNPGHACTENEPDTVPEWSVIFDDIPGWWSIYRGDGEGCRLIDTKFSTKKAAIARMEVLKQEAEDDAR